MKTTVRRNKNTITEVSALLPCTSKPLSDGLQGDVDQCALCNCSAISHQ